MILLKKFLIFKVYNFVCPFLPSTLSCGIVSGRTDGTYFAVGFRGEGWN